MSMISDPSLTPREKVKRLAGARGMSLRALAKAVDYHIVSLHKQLAGERNNPLKRREIADFLGVRVSDIWPKPSA